MKNKRPKQPAMEQLSLPVMSDDLPDVQLDLPDINLDLDLPKLEYPDINLDGHADK